MARKRKSGKRRSLRKRASVAIRQFKRGRRRRNKAAGFGGARSARGFMAFVPGKPIDLVLGGAGAAASGIIVPWAIRKIPIAAIQTDWGHIAATAAVSIALGGVVAKFANKSVGVGLAVGGIAAAGLEIAQKYGLIAMPGMGGYLAGYMDGYGGDPSYALNSGAGINASGYAPQYGMAGYVDA